MLELELMLNFST